MIRVRSSLFVLALLALSPGAGSAAEELAGQQGNVWRFGTLETGKKYPTTVSAHNQSCRGKHTYEISIEGQAREFLQLTGPSRVEGVGRGETRTTDALIDLRQTAPGVYNEGTVVVRCLTCKASCYLDHDVLHVQLTVVGPEGHAGGGAILAGGSPPLGPTHTRNPCPEGDDCDDLRLRAEEAEAAALEARAKARAAERDQAQRDADAANLDAEAARDLEYAATVRRQSADYAGLAADASASARLNRERAERWPAGHKYRQEWERAAEFDEAEAARRQAEAERLAAEAERVEQAARAKRQRANDLRGSSGAAAAEAEAAEREARLARAAYEDCLEQARAECERQKAKLAALANPGSTTGTRTAPGGSGNGTTPAPTSNPADPFAPGGIFAHKAKVPFQKESPYVCSWHTLEVGDINDDLTGVYIGGTTGRPRWVGGISAGSASHRNLEVEYGQRGLSHGPWIKYHCTEPGTVVLYYTYRPFETSRRDVAHRLLGGKDRVGRVLIGCLED